MLLLPNQQNDRALGQTRTRGAPLGGAPSQQRGQDLLAEYHQLTTTPTTRWTSSLPSAIAPAGVGAATISAG
jgi:hypothetical protein